MRRIFLFSSLLLVSTLLWAQGQAPPAGTTPAPLPPFMGAPDLGRLAPLGIGIGRWWTDPDIANQMHLSDAQVKQLEQVTTQQRLALIDAMAGGLKALVLLQPLLDAEQFDENAANQQLDSLAGTAGRLVKDFGGGVLGTRKILTADQWKKLQALQRERAARPPAVVAPRGPRPQGQP